MIRKPDWLDRFNAEGKLFANAFDHWQGSLAVLPQGKIATHNQHS